MRTFFIRSLITVGVFALSAGMIWLMLRAMRGLSLEAETGKSPETASPVFSAPAIPVTSASAPSAAGPFSADSPPPAPPRNILAELNDTMASVVARTLPGVVSIEVERVRTVSQLKLVAGNRPQNEVRTIREQGVGSGTIVSVEGYVITNWHVVAGDNVNIRVVLHGDDDQRPASLVDRDEALDIALLRIEPKTPEETFPCMAFGDSDLMRQGHFVIAVGSPLHLAETVTQGIISNRSRRVSDIQTSFFQTDCIINPGNSGGPLMNLNGELIGINARMVEPPEQASGQIPGQPYGLAIPSNEVQDAYDRMVHKGRPRGYLGVSVDDYPPASYQDGKQPESAVVLGVERGSPAAAAGLRKDDVVKSLDGLPVRSAAEFFRRLRKKQVGESLLIGLRRGSEDQSLKAEVANLDTIFAAQPVPESHDVAGLKVRDLRKAEQTRYHLLKPIGILIENVAPDSPLHGLVTPEELILGVSDNQRMTQIDNAATFLARMRELEGTGGFLYVLRGSGVPERVAFPKN
ncbi:MAG: trypsin-like peptidase domain-containing protein [Verrucomicrobiota bacterium]